MTTINIEERLQNDRIKIRRDERNEQLRVVG